MSMNETLDSLASFATKLLELINQASTTTCGEGETRTKRAVPAREQKDVQMVSRGGRQGELVDCNGQDQKEVSTCRS